MWSASLPHEQKMSSDYSKNGGKVETKLKSALACSKTMWVWLRLSSNMECGLAYKLIMHAHCCQIQLLTKSTHVEVQ